MSAEVYMSKRYKSVLIICLALLLCFFVIWALINSTAQPVLHPSDAVLNVIVNDVGQGDSILVTLGDETMLIDAAEKHKSGEVLDELKKQAVDDIDILIVTHPHSDHIGGLKTVVDSYSIDSVYIADTSSKTKTYSELIDAISKKGIPVYEACAGVTFSFGNASCAIVSPDKTAEYDANNESVAVFLDYGDTEFLFTGDMEKKAEDALIASGYYIDADVLKVAHHGSSTGTSETFLNAVSPDWAAISCGKDNKYNHPHDETLHLLNVFGVKTYRTDIMGDITFVSDGRNINVITEKNGAE
jgi:competence protein ComEC